MKEVRTKQNKKRPAKPELAELYMCSKDWSILEWKGHFLVVPPHFNLYAWGRSGFILEPACHWRAGPGWKATRIQYASCRFR